MRCCFHTQSCKEQHLATNLQFLQLISFWNVMQPQRIFMKIFKHSFYFFERQRQRDSLICWFTPSITAQLVLGQTKAAGRNSIWASHVSGRCPSTWATICCLPGALVGNWIGWWAARIWIGTLIWDVRVAGSTWINCNTTLDQILISFINHNTSFNFNSWFVYSIIKSNIYM